MTDDKGRSGVDHLETQLPSPGLIFGIVDVFVYVVVLNLFVEYLPQVITETFTLSLLTALLLKLVLEVVIMAKTGSRRGSAPLPALAARSRPQFCSGRSFSAASSSCSKSSTWCSAAGSPSAASSR
jgi:hypothetical protein